MVLPAMGWRQLPRAPVREAPVPCGTVDGHLITGDKLASEAVAADDAFVRYSSFVRAVCRAVLRDWADADDAVQETFARAIRHPHALTGNLAPWLRVVALNVCRDELRRRARHSGRVASLDTEAANVSDPSADPEGPVLTRW